MGEKDGITTLLPEQNVTVPGCDYRAVDFSGTLILGEKYTVTIDGIAQEIECTYDDESSAKHLLIVNDSLEIYKEVGDEDYLYFLNRLSDDINITVSIDGLGKVVVPIEEKYIPESVKGGGSTPVYPSSNSKVITSDMWVEHAKKFESFCYLDEKQEPTIDESGNTSSCFVMARVINYSISMFKGSDSDTTQYILSAFSVFLQSSMNPQFTEGTYNTYLTEEQYNEILTAWGLN